MDNINVNTSNTKPSASKLFQSEKEKMNLVPPPYSDYYNMNHPKRGVAIIFNHMNFSMSACSKRVGSDIDRDALVDIFTKLQFNVMVHDDLTVSAVCKVLLEASKMDHSQSDCLVIVVMSHGDETGLCAMDDSYPTHILWNSFSAKKCPTLAGKPKLFFIQACRGEEVHEGHQVRYNNTVETDSDTVEAQHYSIPVMADILIMYATVEGFYAWRSEFGSFFIQSLVKQLKQHGIEKDLLTTLTFVNREVAIDFTLPDTPDLPREYVGAKQLCSIVSTLTRLLFFPVNCKSSS